MPEIFLTPAAADAVEDVLQNILAVRGPVHMARVTALHSVMQTSDILLALLTNTLDMDATEVSRVDDAHQTLLAQILDMWNVDDAEATALLRDASTVRTHMQAAQRASRIERGEGPGDML